MNYIRKLVSGERRRYTAEGYDLDLTYITDRIIAMSFPAGGFMEAAYRNPISEVSRFLREHHGDNYWVFNCSERAYDKKPFEN